MPESSTTFRLLATAYACGDLYYRHSSRMLQKGIQQDDECIRLAKGYLEELSSLNKHLQSLPPSNRIVELKNSTATYIDLVQQDLKRYAAFKRANPSARANTNAATQLDTRR